MTNENRRPEPSAAAEGKANGQREAAEATTAAEIFHRQRSMMNALLCCMI